MGMAIGGAGKKGDVKPVMNVTPLVDVVLVLLIIFMVVTPLLSKQLWLNLPKKDDQAKEAPPPDENRNIVVTVAKDGTIKVNSEIIPRDGFRERLARMLAAKSEKIVYFDAENGAPYATTVEVMDLSRQGGAKAIAIMTETIIK